MHQFKLFQYFIWHAVQMFLYWIWAQKSTKILKSIVKSNYILLKPEREGGTHLKRVKEKFDISTPKSNIFKKYGNFQLQQLKFGSDFHQKAGKILQNISSKAPVFWWKFTHKTPLSRQFIHTQAPKFRNLGCTYPLGKKLSAHLKAKTWLVIYNFCLQKESWLINYYM